MNKNQGFIISFVPTMQVIFSFLGTSFMAWRNYIALKKKKELGQYIAE